MQLLTCTALLPAVHLAASRPLLPQILEEMVKSEMGLDMDLSFFDKPAPPTGGDGEPSGSSGPSSRSSAHQSVISEQPTLQSDPS